MAAAQRNFMEMEAELPEEDRQILDYYGATLDNSGEPDNEMPDEEGVLTMPTPEEQERERQEWAATVAAWER